MYSDGQGNFTHSDAALGLTEAKTPHRLLVFPLCRAEQGAPAGAAHDGHEFADDVMQ